MAPVCLAARPVTFRGTPQLLAGGLVPAWCGRLGPMVGWRYLGPQYLVVPKQVSNGSSQPWVFSTGSTLEGQQMVRWHIDPVRNGLTGSLASNPWSTRRRKSNLNMLAATILGC
ncbi:unnamed protein product [Clonostachys solani]|uniref:Uncharacterized protein n=1 Tax=Clonostachys solani TaxID=160281 RepID=A0A9N9Z5L1_9HYPO|nr:unnamed protein product [Clonostachys solani]